MRSLLNLACVIALPISAAGIPSAVHAGEYRCKTDYRNSGLTAEQIKELCREEQLGGDPPGGEDDGDGKTYPGRYCSVASRIGDCDDWNPR